MTLATTSRPPDPRLEALISSLMKVAEALRPVMPIHTKVLIDELSGQVRPALFTRVSAILRSTAAVPGSELSLREKWTRNYALAAVNAAEVIAAGLAWPDDRDDAFETARWKLDEVVDQIRRDGAQGVTG